MKCPAEVYSASPRPYPLHDREVLVTACGRICMHRKRINVSTVLAGQRLGIKEVDDGIWIVSFMVWFSPGEKHWHGATATPAMTHIAIVEQLNGKTADWMEHVSDEQYRAVE